jgi:hypothetical protein
MRICFSMSDIVEGVVEGAEAGGFEGLGFDDEAIGFRRTFGRGSRGRWWAWRWILRLLVPLWRWEGRGNGVFFWRLGG